MLMMNEAYYTVDSHAEFLICNHGDFWIRGTIRHIRLHFLKSGYKANQDEEKKTFGMFIFNYIEICN